MRKHLRFILLAILAAMPFVWWHGSVKPLPFDSKQWVSGDAKLRYRMKDALIGKYQAGGLASRDTLDAELGPDDDRASDPTHRYFRLLSPVIANPWYVRVRMSEEGKIIQFLVSAD